MFSSGSVEKSSATLAENSSPTRGNFPVGISSLGDEGQQNIRIQLAVHRYNNSPGSSYIRPISERCAASFKHGFIKSTQKYKNCENDKKEVHNGLKKSHNQYQGVGSFPVVHLKKNTVIGKPVKRPTSGAFKIQVPEVPFNRFLNHSPDICLDTKTSTRSVLDVLQDLSRKRIHTKDDSDATKRKCKGLGGDTPLDFEAPYKPLFVTKSKGNTVTYRDSMTQTQEISQLDSTYAKKNDIALNNDKNDPKAELRRKLARQNNEIFASLSSSTLTYPYKRSSGRISAGKDESKQDEPKTKRTKYLSIETNGKNIENGGSSSKELLAGQNSVDHYDKVEKKQKTVDSNKISPNKDRLTAIFLEMQNVNPKVEVLAKNQITNGKENSQSVTGLNAVKSNEKCTTEEHQNSERDKSITNSVSSISSEPSRLVTNVNGNLDSSKISTVKAASGTNIFGISSPSAVTISKETSVNGKNNVTPITTTSSFILPISSNVQFGFSPENPNFKIPVASTISSSLTQTPIFSTGISQKASSSELNSPSDGNKVNTAQEKVQDSTNIQRSFAHSPNQGLLFQSPCSEESKSGSKEVGQKQNTTDLFNFGVGGSLQSQTLSVNQTQSPVSTSNEKDRALKNTVNQPLRDPGTFTVTSSGILTNGSSSSAVQSSSSLTISTATISTITSTQSQQSTSFFPLSDKPSSLENQATEKSSTFPFSFGQTPATSSIPSPLFGTNNNATVTSKPQVQSAAEEKAPSNDGANLEKSKQINSTLFSQNNFSSNSFSSAAPSFGQNMNNSLQNNQNIVPFKFGEKTDNQSVKLNSDNSLSTPNSNLFEKKPQPSVFNFGQKPATQDGLQLPSTQPTVSQPNLFQSSVFTFGQKPSTPVSSSQVIGNSSLFGQGSSVQTNLFQQNNVSQSNATISNSLLNSSSPFCISSQSNLNDNKNQMPSFIQTTSSAGISSINNSFTQNKLSLPTFGTSTVGTSPFGQGTSSNLPNETNIFGSNTSQNTSTFGAGSAVQNNPFSQPFGDNSNKQQSGNNATPNFFMQSSTPQNTGFGQNAVFGSSTFGQNATENNIFGQKTQLGGFDQNQNVQSSPFGQSPISQTFGSQAPFTFGGSSTASTSSAFTPNATTAASVFTFGSSTKTTTASTSNFGFSSTSQPSSSSQSLFNFNSQPNNNAFKFGSGSGSTAGSSSGSFSFDSNPSASEASKPAASVFSFGGSQNSTQNTGFNFGAAPSPVFSFGDSATSANNAPKFSFGAAQPNTGIFTPGVTPSPTIPFKGAFSIGSGSTQSRNRSAATRARRRT